MCANHAIAALKDSARDCPLKTKADWQEFVQNAIDSPKWVETCEDNPCDKRFHKHVESKVASVLKACSAAIEADAGLKDCTARLRAFVPMWLRQHDSASYGFDIGNAAYFARQTGPDKPPGMMEIPQAIVDALPDQSRVQEAARTHGWRYLTHDSGLTGFRTFVYRPDPDGKFDQWMLLNLTGAQQKQASLFMPVSLLAVQKKTANGQPLERIKVHFRDFSMLPVGPSRVSLITNPNGDGKCFSCHVSGLRELIPRKTAITDARPVFGEAGFGEKAPPRARNEFGFLRLQEFNRIIRRYGPVDWDDKIQKENTGPILGQSQGCVTCHNNESRGALSVFTSNEQLYRKLAVELAMPPTTDLVRLLERKEMKNPVLRADEEAALENSLVHGETLYNQFMSSRLPELKKWISSRSCN